MRAWWLAAALVLAASSAACGGGPCGRTPNELTGSVGELYDIVVDSVRAKKVSETEVTLEFLHGNDIVAKIVADVSAFTKGTRIPLTGGDVRRVTSPDTQFPRMIERGSIVFESDLVAGSEVSACFDILFGAGTDGTKRTLNGAIKAPLEEVGGS